MSDYQIENNIIRDPEGRVKFRKLKEGGYDHYHVGVWLSATPSSALDRVQRVEYELHPTFANPIRRSSNRANDFSITFWSWGTFEISARIFLVGNPEPIEISHHLKYNLPPDEGKNYVQVA